MQYILSQEEFSNMVPKKDLENAKKAIEVLTLYILKREPFPGGFPCIGRGYCDDCPLGHLCDENNLRLRDVCPEPMLQEWSQ